MKKLASLLLAAMLLSFVTVSCKKYEEGPTFSLASKKGRVAGDWTVESAVYVEADGTQTDETALVQQYFTKFSFAKDGGFTLEAYGDTYTGTWEFDDKKENIIVKVEGEIWNFEITRLKSKELWAKWKMDPADTEYFDMKFKQ